MQRVSFAASMRGLLVAGMLVAPVWGQTPFPHPRPGSINYVEGQASIGNTPLTAGAVGTVELSPNQPVTTETGKVEILLTPGVFLRLGDHSSVTLTSPDSTHAEVRLNQGRALLEVIDIHKENNILVDQNGANTRLLKKGLYDFDADHKEVRVFGGSALVSAGNQKLTLSSKEKVDLGGDGLKATGIRTGQYEDDFYGWNGLRSGYLSEASVDIARTYIGPGPDPYTAEWCGAGWYWNPWFSVYTFVPADGVFYGPFGWGFYSPIAVYSSPFAFYGHSTHLFSDFHYPYGHGFPPPAGRGSRIGR